MRIMDKHLIEELGVINKTYYEWKRKHPRRVDLMKKGLLAEKLLKDEVFEELIKPNNKRSN
jgi:hypothetical protein